MTEERKHRGTISEHFGCVYLHFEKYKNITTAPLRPRRRELLNTTLTPSSTIYKNTEDSSCAWAVDVNGKIHFRESVYGEGNKWKLVEGPKISVALTACQLTVSGNGIPFMLMTDGNFVFRAGIIALNPAGTVWVTFYSPPGGVRLMSAGKDTLWVITSDWKCWTLSENLQDVLDKTADFVSAQPLKIEWIEIPGNYQGIYVCHSNLTVLALDKDDNKLLYRTEITENHPWGQGWKDMVGFPSISTETVNENIDDTDSQINSKELQMQMHNNQENGGIPSNFLTVKEVHEADCDHDITAQGSQNAEYRHVLYFLLTHALHYNSVVEFNAEVETAFKRSNLISLLNGNETLNILEKKSGESPAVIDLEKWRVYSRVQCEYPWRANLFSIFPPLMSTILSHRSKQDLNVSDMTAFWLACDNLFYNFPAILSNMFDESISKLPTDDLDSESDENDELVQDSFEKMLNKFVILGPHKYEAIKTATVTADAEKFFEAIEKDAQEQSKIDTEIVTVTKIGTLIISDISKVKRERKLAVFQTICKVYYDKFANLVKPLVIKTLGTLKPINFGNDAISIPPPFSRQDFMDQIQIRKNLFLLYLEVVQFISDSNNNKKSGSSSPLEESLKISTFFPDDPDLKSFVSCVSLWLDVAWYEVTSKFPRILKPYRNCPYNEKESLKFRFCPSGRETCCVFNNNYYSYVWKSLRWTNADQAFAITSRILHDFQMCIKCYWKAAYPNNFDTLKKPAAINGSHPHENSGSGSLGVNMVDIFFTTEICVAVSNLDCLCENMNSLHTKLMAEIFDDIKNKCVSKIDKQHRCTHCTLLNIVRDTADEIEGRISRILGNLQPEMDTKIFRFLKDLLDLENEPQNEDKPHIKKALDDYFLQNLNQISEKMSTRQREAHSLFFKATFGALKSLIETHIQQSQNRSRKCDNYYDKYQQILNILETLCFPESPFLLPGLGLGRTSIDSYGDKNLPAIKPGPGPGPGPVPGSTPSSIQNITQKSINEIKHLLQDHFLPTSALILKYTRDLYEQHQVRLPSLTHDRNSNANLNKKVNQYQNSMITFRAAYFEDSEILRIEILNCRRLKTKREVAQVQMQTRAYCNEGDTTSEVCPYVTVNLIPLEIYKMSLRKTQKFRKTNFPLIEETFEFPLKKAEKALGGLISMRVYHAPGHCCCLQAQEILGEALVPLDSVPVTLSCAVAPAAPRSPSLSSTSSAMASFKYLPQNDLPVLALSLGTSSKDDGNGTSRSRRSLRDIRHLSRDLYRNFSIQSRSISDSEEMSTAAINFQDLPQQDVSLTLPFSMAEAESCVKILEVLETRSWDPRAAKFVRREKRRELNIVDSNAL